MTDTQTQFVYKILKSENYDGDSLNLTLDLGFELVLYRKCRLFGVDTPEMRDPRPDYRAAAEVAKKRVALFMDAAIATGDCYFVSEEYAGKFGRALGDVLHIAATTRFSLRDELIKGNMGVPYHGENKSEIAKLHAENIRKLKEAGRI